MLAMILWLLIAGLGGMMLGWSGGKSRLGLALVIIAAVFILKPAFGQDHSGHRPQDIEAHRLFYNSWKMPDNRSASCCHERDCRPAEINYINGRLHARQEGDGGDFTLIPPAKIEHDRDSPDGRNHLCGNRYGVNGSFNVFCFIAGSGG